ncbi:MAG TPA: DNA-directed RNA polymerase subunit omega [Ignavibacteriaceae bacterium]|jgi:hypothetical protein|nr:DNA-directed RNA polymerase subunit omega [Ignavibacteriaceae bacterium]
MGIEPIDLREIDKKTANVYEAIIVASRRARQMNDEQKIEFNAQLSTVPQTSATDDDSEDFDNPAQLRISLDFEKRKKPHQQALDKLLEGEVEFEYKS